MTLHDAHVVQAAKLLRDVGFTLEALQFPRPPDALKGLRRFNNIQDNWIEPMGWRYFPNAWCRDNWQRMTPMTPIITYQQLKARKACPSERRKFKYHFGDVALVTEANARLHFARFDFWWAGANLLFGGHLDFFRQQRELLRNTQLSEANEICRELRIQLNKDVKVLDAELKPLFKIRASSRTREQEATLELNLEKRHLLEQNYRAQSSILTKPTHQKFLLSVALLFADLYTQQWNVKS